MRRIAVIQVDGSSVQLHLEPDPPPPSLAVVLESLRATWRGSGVWELEPSAVEPLCSALDRLGVVWGMSTASAPRTWAERIFAETPSSCHGALLEALRSALGREADHLAVLNYAWTTRPGGTS